jgi:hypothetical protein
MGAYNDLQTLINALESKLKCEYFRCGALYKPPQPQTADAREFSHKTPLKRLSRH